MRKIIDLHTDTITRDYPKNIDIFKDEGYMISYEKMKRGGYLAVALAIFIHLEKRADEPFKLAKLYFDRLDKLVQDHPSELKFYDGKDDGRLSIIRTIEEGEAIEGSLEKLNYLIDRGLQMMTLTWNFANSLAYPNRVILCDDKKSVKLVPEEENGLTPKGIEVLKVLEERHVLLDVSHLGDRGFYQVFDHYHGPVVASHSNARSVRDVARNLKDDMIIKIAKSGGVIGLNLCEYFVMEEGEDYLNRLADHAEHIRDIGGIDVLAIGSDFDGISTPPEILDASCFGKFFAVLEKRGWSQEEIDKLSYLNAKRVLEWVL